MRVEQDLRNFHTKPSFMALLILCVTLLVTLGGVNSRSLNAAQTLPTQESLPAPPADRALVYVTNESNALVALPFEAGTTPISVDKVATSDKRSYVELKGEASATILKTEEPRFYLFVPDVPNVHPPFIVRLTQKRGARRVTAMAQKGYKGFAIDSAEIIKPHYRVLGSQDGMQYLEIRPRDGLMPGEYAIIGTDLQRIATFRISGAATQE
jgi:hypothetical protein